MKIKILHILLCPLLVLALSPAALAATLDTTDLTIDGNTITIGPDQGAVLEALHEAGKTAKIAVPYEEAEVYVLKDDSIVVAHNWNTEGCIQFEVPGAGVYVITTGTPPSMDAQLSSGDTSVVPLPNDSLHNSYSSVADGTVIYADGSAIKGADGDKTLTAAGSLTIQDLPGGVDVILGAGDKITFDTNGKAIITPAMNTNELGAPVGYGSVRLTTLDKNGSAVTKTYFLAEGEKLVIGKAGTITGSEVFNPGAADAVAPEYGVSYYPQTNKHVLNSSGKITALSNGLYDYDTSITLTLEGSGTVKTLAEKVDGKDKVYVSGVKVSENGDGTVKLVLESGYLNTLPVGKHTLTFRYNDGGSAVGILRIVKEAAKADETNPKTGDPVMLVVVTMVLCAAALTMVNPVIGKKKW